MGTYSPEEWERLTQHSRLGQDERYFTGDENESLWGDAWTAVKHTGLDLARTAAGTVDLATGGAATELVGGTLDRWEEGLNREYSADTQIAQMNRQRAIDSADGEVGKGLTAIGETISNPRLLLTDGLRMAGQTVAPILPARAIGLYAGAKAATRAASAAKAGGVADAIASKQALEAGLEARAKWAGRAAVLGEGGMGAGATANQVVSENLAEGRDPTTGLWSAPAVGAATSIIAGGAGKLSKGANLESILAGGKRNARKAFGLDNPVKAKTNAPQSLLGRTWQGTKDVMKSFASEGAEEAAQGVFETALPNYALDKPITEGMGENVGQSALMGGLMGGGMHMATLPFRRDMRDSLSPEKKTEVNMAATNTPMYGTSVPNPNPPTGGAGTPPAGTAGTGVAGATGVTGGVTTPTATPTGTPNQPPAVQSALAEVEAEDRAKAEDERIKAQNKATKEANKAKKAADDAAKKASAERVNNVRQTYFPRTMSPAEESGSMSLRTVEDGKELQEFSDNPYAEKQALANAADEAYEETRLENGRGRLAGGSTTSLISAVTGLMNGPLNEDGKTRTPPKNNAEIQARAEQRAEKWIKSKNKDEVKQARFYKYLAEKLKNPKATPAELRKIVDDWAAPHEATPEGGGEIQNKYQFKNPPNKDAQKRWNKAKKSVGDADAETLVRSLIKHFKGEDISRDGNSIIDQACHIIEQVEKHKGKGIENLRTFFSRMAKTPDGELYDADIEAVLRDIDDIGVTMRAVAGAARHFVKTIEKAEAKKTEPKTEAPKAETQQETPKAEEKPSAPEDDDGPYDTFFAPKLLHDENKKVELSDEDKEEIRRSTGNTFEPSEESAEAVINRTEKDESANESEDNETNNVEAVTTGLQVTSRPEESWEKNDDAKEEKGSGGVQVWSEEPLDMRASKGIRDQFRVAIATAMEKVGFVVNTDLRETRRADGSLTGKKERTPYFTDEAKTREAIARSGKKREVYEQFQEHIPALFVDLCQVLYSRIQSTPLEAWDSNYGVGDFIGEMFSIVQEELSVVNATSPKSPFVQILQDLYMMSNASLRGKVELDVDEKKANTEAKRAKEAMLSRLSGFVPVKDKPMKSKDANGKVIDSGTIQRRNTKAREEARAQAIKNARAYFTRKENKATYSIDDPKIIAEAEAKGKTPDEILTEKLGRLRSDVYSSDKERDAYSDYAVDRVKEGDKELSDREFFDSRDGGTLNLREKAEVDTKLAELTKNDAGKTGKKRYVQGEDARKLGETLAKTVLNNTFYPVFLHKGEKLQWFSKIKAAVGDVSKTFIGDVIGYTERITSPFALGIQGVRSLIKSFVSDSNYVDKNYGHIHRAELQPYKKRLEKTQSALRINLMATIVRDPALFYHAYRMSLKKIVHAQISPEKGRRESNINRFDEAVREYVEAAALTPAKKAEINAHLDQTKELVVRRLKMEEVNLRSETEPKIAPTSPITTEAQAEKVKAARAEEEAKQTAPIKRTEEKAKTKLYDAPWHQKFVARAKKIFPNAAAFSESFAQTGDGQILSGVVENLEKALSGVNSEIKNRVAKFMDDAVPNVASTMKRDLSDYGYWVMNQTAQLIDGATSADVIRKRADAAAAKLTARMGKNDVPTQLKAMQMKQVAQLMAEPSLPAAEVQRKVVEWAKQTGKVNNEAIEIFQRGNRQSKPAPKAEETSEKADEKPEPAKGGANEASVREAPDLSMSARGAAETAIKWINDDLEVTDEKSFEDIRKSSADKEAIDNAAFLTERKECVALPLDTAAKLLRKHNYDPSCLVGVFSESTALTLANGVKRFDSLGWHLPQGVVIGDTIRARQLYTGRTCFTSPRGIDGKIDAVQIKDGTKISLSAPGGIVYLGERPLSFHPNKDTIVSNLSEKHLEVLKSREQQSAFHELMHAVLTENGDALGYAIGETLADLGIKETDFLEKIVDYTEDCTSGAKYVLRMCAKHAVGTYRSARTYIRKSEELARQTGYSVEELLGMSFADILAYPRMRMGDEFFVSLFFYWVNNTANIREECSKLEGWEKLAPYFEGVNKYVRSIGTANDTASNNGGTANTEGDGEATRPELSPSRHKHTNGADAGGDTKTPQNVEATSKEKGENKGSVSQKSKPTENGAGGSADVPSSSTENGQGSTPTSAGSEQSSSTVVLQRGSGKSVLPPQGSGGSSGSTAARRSVEATATDKILSLVPAKYKPIARTFLGVTSTFGLQGMFTRNLVDSFSQLVPSARTWWHHVEKMMQERSKWQQNAADVAERFHRLSKYEQGKTNQLLLESTIEGFWAYRDKRVFPTDEEWKRYLNSYKGEEKKKYMNFLRKYESLSTAAKASFAEVINAGTTEKIELARIQKQNSESSLNLQAKNADAKKLAELKAKQKENEARIDAALKEAVKKPYVSLGRQGNFVVTFRSPAYMEAVSAYEQYKASLAQTGKERTDKERRVLKKLKDRMDDLATDPNNYIVEFFNSRLDSNKRYYELKEKYPNNPEESIQTFEKALYLGSQTPKWANFAEILREVNKAMEAEDGTGSIKEEDLQRFAEVANEVYIHSQSDTSAKKAELHRRVIPGYNDNMIENFIEHAKKMSHLVASMDNAWNIRDALDAAGTEAKNQAYMGRRDQATIVVNELRRRQGQIFAPASTKYSGKVMRATSMWMLLTNPAFYLQNLLQPGMMSAPYINGKLGINCLGELTRTMKNVMDFVRKDRTLQNLKNTLSDNEFEALMHARDRQLLTIGITSEFGEGGEGAFGKATSWLTDKAQVVEIVNRVSTHLVAYKNARKKGMSHEDAMAFAERTLEQTHGDYSKENAPSFFNRNDFTKMATQFRKFQFIQAGLIYRMLRDSVSKELGPAERAIARRQLMWIVGTHFAMAGLKGTPLIAQTMAIVGFVMGMGGSGDDDEDLIRKSVKDKGVSDFLLMGIPSLLGVDLSKKVGAGDFHNPLPFFEYDITKGKRNIGDLSLQVLGPWASVPAKVAEGLKYLNQGDYAKGIEQILPHGLLSNGVKALRLGTQGFTSASGDLLIKPEGIGAWDMGGTMLGLTTSTVGDRTRLQGSLIRHDNEFNNTKADIQRRYNEAKEEHDYVGMREALKDLGVLNRHRRNAGYTPIQPKQLESTYKAKKTREANVRGGVTTTKQNRRFVEQYSRW